MRRPTWMLLLDSCALRDPYLGNGSKIFSAGGYTFAVTQPCGIGSGLFRALGVGAGLQPTTAEFGIQAGDFVVQPRLFLEGAYTTNFYREDPRSQVSGQTTELTDVFMMQLRPGIGMYNPGFSR